MRPGRRLFFTLLGRGHQELVLKTINDATKSIRMMAFSFSAPDIMNALVAA